MEWHRDVHCESKDHENLKQSHQSHKDNQQKKMKMKMMMNQEKSWWKRETMKRKEWHTSHDHDETAVRNHCDRA